MQGIWPLLGVVYSFGGVGMLIPFGIALAERGPDRLALGLSAAISIVLGGLMALPLLERRQEDIDQRGAILVVVLSWLGLGVLGALPFVLNGTLGPVDALFESISGFTTTGASVIAQVEALPAGLSFWRCFTHWLGGMGIIVLVVAALPLLGPMGYQLFRTEAPAMDEDRFIPRVTRTAQALLVVYVALTLSETVLLMLGGLPLLDALAHSFATIATGGFSTRNASVGAYHSLYVELVVIAFMVMGSLPFWVHYRGLRNPRAYLESSQTRLHLGLLAAACAAVSIQLWLRGVYSHPGEAFRYGSFQVTSLMTTTGFATADSEQWTSFSHIILITVMFVGGCNGSTAGAIKTFRVLALGKVMKRQFTALLHPNAVRPVRIGGQKVDEEVLRNAGTYIFAYLLTAVAGTVALVVCRVDPLTAVSATAATLGGVGPGLGAVGPYDNYGWMPPEAKFICMALMLLGRLEIFMMVAMCHLDFWRGW